MRSWWARIVRAVNAIPEPTVAGRIALTFLLIAFWLAVAKHNNPALFVFCAVLATVLLSVVVTHLAPARLSVERRVPRRVFAGEAFDVRLRLRNESRWRPAFGIGFRDALQTEEPGELTCGPEVAVLPPGGCVEIAYVKRVHRRGVLTISNALAATRFPFGLFEKKVLLRSRRSRIVVLPALGRLRRAAQYDLACRLETVRTEVQRRDGLEEFHSIREFRAGDNPRLIHWRTTARTQKLMRRVMRDESGSDLVVFLDTYVGGLRAQVRQRHLEKAVSCAATLLVAAARQGRKAAVHFPGGVARHAGRMREVLPALEVLAGVRGGTTKPHRLVGGGARRRGVRALLLSLCGTAAKARAAGAGRGLDVHVWDVGDPAFERYFQKR